MTDLAVRNPWDKIQFQERKQTDLLVIHCSATGEEERTAKEIDLWHRQRGFAAIGYHYVIRRSGVVETGRPINTVGAHALPFNSRSIGICLIGGVDANDRTKAANNFTPEQWASLYDLIRVIQLQYSGLHILGHRDLPKVEKACPSFDAREWVAEKGIDNAPVPAGAVR